MALVLGGTSHDIEAATTPNRVGAACYRSAFLLNQLPLFNFKKNCVKAAFDFPLQGLKNHFSCFLLRQIFNRREHPSIICMYFKNQSVDSLTIDAKIVDLY